MNGEARLKNQPERTCMSADEAYASAFGPNDPLIAAVVPVFWLVVAWIIGGIAYISLRWIRKGFATR